MTNSSLFTKIEAYLLTEKRVSANTFSAYKQDMKQFDAFLAQHNLALKDVTRNDLTRFLLHLKSMNISARSMARKIATLRMIFTYAQNHLGIDNCAQDLSIPKIEQRLPTFLTEQEIQQLLAYTDSDQSELGKRNRVLLYLLYVSGMRISELTHLNISDIRFDIGILSINGKGGKERMVPVPQAMLDMLRDYLNAMRVRMKAKDDATPDYVFPVCYGNKIKPISRQSCWIILQNLCKKAGIKRHISPHILRHSLATHLLKNGADVRSIQIILGHENLATMQIYTHVETGHLRKVYDKKHPRS